MTQSNDSVLSLVKDIGLGLVQISGLLLTVNLAIVVGTLPAEARAEITGQIFASSTLLGVSIAIGLVVLALLTEIKGGAEGKRDCLENITRWLSAAQLTTFLAAMALMIWAVWLRLEAPALQTD